MNADGPERSVGRKSVLGIGIGVAIERSPPWPPVITRFIRVIQFLRRTYAI
jgi:hypothetical protein